VKKPGQIAVVRFPRPDLEVGKLRPVLLIAKLPGDFDDWLVCMISTQLRHEITGFDETVRSSDPDFAGCGLKVTSLVRIARLAAVEGKALIGALGEISAERVARIRSHLGAWLTAQIAP